MKKIILLAITLFSIEALHAQFQCDLGVSYAGSSTKSETFMRPYTIWGTSIKDTNFYSYDYGASGYGIYAYPKYHIAQLNEFTVSLGAPFMIGVGGSANSEQGSSLNYIYDMNVCLDVNAGRLNRRQDNPDKPFGFFAGIGFGLLNTSGLRYSGGLDNSSTHAFEKNITYVPEGGYFDEYMRAKSSSLLIHAGVVGPMFKKESKKSIGLRFFVKPGFGQKQLTYFGISAFVGFSRDRNF